ncbi:MAG: hypothetical protein WC028_26750 [Candidatus Obscuribacterales bacterium]
MNKFRMNKLDSTNYRRNSKGKLEDSTVHRPPQETGTNESTIAIDARYHD